MLETMKGVVFPVGILLVVFVTSCRSAKHNYTGNGETREYWLNLGKADLERARQKPPVSVAKNVILFLGDGMGVSTVTAARILQGQLAGRPGEEGALSFEKFPYVGLAKTYNQNAQTPDSAGTATAFLSGVKTNERMLGVDARARYGDCASVPGTELETILDWAHDKGKSVGIVTTTRITHATPAAMYAKSPNRGWECDTDMPSDNVTSQCDDIAKQLIDNNPDIKVILGGGRRKFLRQSDIDPETGRNHSAGRSDGRNLIQDWQTKQAELGRSYSYVWNSSAFNDVDPDTTDYLLGLFSDSHMNYMLDRDTDVGGEPTIAEMTDKAIRILARNPNGFFLLVEGGRIDHAHHASRAQRSLYETLAFSDAVEKASELTRERDTLTVVTADHSHVFTMGGYPGRGNPIIGLTVEDGATGPSQAQDGKPYTTLMYTNGPGAFATAAGAPRPNITEDILDDFNYRQQSAVPLSSETHGGEDVTVYARGPMAHLVTGVHEQSYVAHVMAYAACMGGYSDPGACALVDVADEGASSHAVVIANVNVVMGSVVMISSYLLR